MTAWKRAGGESQFLRWDGPGFASNDEGRLPVQELCVTSDAECQFEIYRADEVRMTSSLFSGGDWCWRLVSTDGGVLAEATGHPNEGTCRSALAALQRHAAKAPVHPYTRGQK